MGLLNSDTPAAAQQTQGTVTANNMAITPAQQPVQPAQVAPPAYENEKSHAVATTGTPGQPRTDDPSRVEMEYANNQPPAMVTPRESLRYEPAWIDCPFCHQRSITDVKKSESDTTWIYTLLCCLCCGCIGAIFPLIFGWGADFDHACKTCGNRVARVPHEGASNQMVQVFGPQAANPVATAPMQGAPPGTTTIKQ